MKGPFEDEDDDGRPIQQPRDSREAEIQELRGRIEELEEVVRYWKSRANQQQPQGK